MLRKSMQHWSFSILSDSSVSANLGAVHPSSVSDFKVAIVRRHHSNCIVAADIP